MDKDTATNLIMYHGADMDGWCAGTIAGMYCKSLGYDRDDISYYAANYVPGVDDIMDIITELPDLKTIYIVDYHIPAEDMLSLLENGYTVYWADHHVSAFKEYAPYMSKLAKYKFKTFFQYTDETKSGALLIYEALFNGREQNDYPNMAKVVNLVSVYDTWSKNSPLWERAKALHYGVMGNVHPPYGLFHDMFEYEDVLDYVVNVGRFVLAKEQERYKDLCASNAGLLEWEGRTFISINGHGNSANFESYAYPKIFDAGMVWSFSAKTGLWKVSMYGLDCSPEGLDLSDIAKKYGGGGHAKACGFMVKELPFDIKNIKPLPVE